MITSNELTEDQRAMMDKIKDDLLCALNAFNESAEQEVDNPSHYRSTGMDVIDVIEQFKLNFNLGNVIKYVLRAGKKCDSGITDLKKAFWYLEREINAQEEDR